MPLRVTILVLGLVLQHTAFGALAQNPAFSVFSTNSAWWLATPERQPFISLGVCCVHQGFSREDFDEENPGYAACHHYSNSVSWAETATRRLASWGFTTIGAWGDYQTLRQAGTSNLFLTPVLHIGSTAGAPWWDMWDPKVIRRMDDTARGQILAVRDDPRLLGYYTDNELGWWNATLFKMTLEQPSSSGQRQRLIQLLRKSYGNDWKKLLADFEPENADSWSTLRRRGMLFLRKDGHGIRVMRQFLEMLADRYYELTREIIRKYDRRGLILGDRYQSFYYPEVARAAARHVDVISSNLNAHWNDGTFLRCYLDTLYALTGKPIIVSEIYMASAENRSGNKNNYGVFPVAPTQPERAAAARRTLEQLLQLPYVVGIEWFQYFDEPTHGRHDGENFGFGLVDIHDRPYSEMTNAFATLEPMRLKLAPRLPRPDAGGGIPPAPSDPLANFLPTQALKHWDREHGFVKPSSDFPLADLYVCWSPQAVYLGIYTLDTNEDAYYRDRNVPKSDHPVWTIQIDDRPAVRVRLRSARDPLVSDPDKRVLSLSGMDGRHVALIEITAVSVGRTSFKAGDMIQLTSLMTGHAQAHRTAWQGKFRLGTESVDRARDDAK